MNMEYQRCLEIIWSLIPKGEFERVYRCGYCDLDHDFLGFIDTYYHLSRIISDEYTIVDLGCAFAPQSYFFRNFRKYIGVDIACETFFRQNESDGNCSFYGRTGITEFLHDIFPTLGIEPCKCFAIMNFVPDFEGVYKGEAKKVFPNMYSFYPTTFGTKVV